jgi:hypothetical protein
MIIFVNKKLECIELKTITRQFIPLMVEFLKLSKWPDLIMGDAFIDRTKSVYTNNICFGRKCFLFGIAINLLLLHKNYELIRKGLAVKC